MIFVLNLQVKEIPFISGFCHSLLIVILMAFSIVIFRLYLSNLCSKTWLTIPKAFLLQKKLATLKDCPILIFIQLNLARNDELGNCADTIWTFQNVNDLCQICFFCKDLVCYHFWAFSQL